MSPPPFTPPLLLLLPLPLRLLQMPKGSDSTFAAKLRQHHSGHPRFGQGAGAAARGAPGDDFTVQHYAGPVTYSAAKFLDKNRDTLSKGGVGPLAAAGGRAIDSASGRVLCVWVGGWVGGRPS